MIVIVGGLRYRNISYKRLFIGGISHNIHIFYIHFYISAFMDVVILMFLFFSEDLDNDIDEIVQEFESKSQREILHSVLFY